MFAAIFNADRRPVDLARMGLAVGEVRLLGAAGHVALVHTAEPSFERESESSGIRALGDRQWLAGRIRLDRRDELAAKLGVAVSDDALLCLSAHEKWGDSFVAHLAGDFCFVLWDGARQRLLAVRDQLGIRVLFHARVGSTWVLSDSLDWIASWREVDRELDDYWIADFLSFGHPLDFDRTVYRNIRRLPPAHVASLDSGGLGVRRYWRLDIREPLYLRHHREYGERFREVVLRAVGDRLPAGRRVGISMSGGLDSTSLAALSVEASGTPAQVVGTCFHYETHIPDDEAGFAKIAAAHVGIALDLVAVDGNVYDPAWRSCRVTTAEPWSGIVQASSEQGLLRSMAERAGVWFEGEGPDNALRFERDAYLGWLVRERRWARLAEACWLYARYRGRGGWAQTFSRYFGGGGQRHPASRLPDWLNRDLVRRLCLEERLERSECGVAPPHPWHPLSVASFGDPIWQGILSDCDVDETLAPLVWRHPYLDLQVVQFLLSLPPVPWARRKLVIRQAMKGRLPAAILARDKAPLRGDPASTILEDHGLPPFEAASELGRWVDIDRLKAAGAKARPARHLLPAHALDYWLAAR